MLRKNGLGGLDAAVPVGVEAGVDAVTDNKFAMAPSLDQAAVIEDQDLIGGLGG